MKKKKKHMNPHSKYRSCVSRRGRTVSVVGRKEGRTGWLFCACSKVQKFTCYAFVCVFSTFKKDLFVGRFDIFRVVFPGSCCDLETLLNIYNLIYGPKQHYSDFVQFKACGCCIYYYYCFHSILSRLEKLQF